jgi:uncharacterized protein YkwD
LFYACFWIVTAMSLTVLTLGCAAAPAAVDPVVALTAIRSNGCGNRTVVRSVLRQDARLDRVAARLSGGGNLASAIAAEKYPAARSTSIQILRAPSQAAVSRLLETQFCTEITDAAFENIGSARREGQTWLVLAAPFEAPRVSDGQQMASRVLALVNTARSRARLCGNQKFAAAEALKLDPTLARVAEAHARDMMRHNRMSHTGSDGSNAADRVTRAGYPWRAVAENVASGQTSAEEVVQTWLQSPGHCVNLMRPDLREMGVAYAFDPSSEAGTYWAQVFAARR